MNIDDMKPTELKAAIEDLGLPVPDGDVRTAAWKEQAKSVLRTAEAPADKAEDTPPPSIVKPEDAKLDEHLGFEIEGLRLLQSGLETVAIAKRGEDCGAEYSRMANMIGHVTGDIQRVIDKLTLISDEYKRATATIEDIKASRERAKQPKPAKPRYVSKATLRMGERTDQQEKAYPDRAAAINAWARGGERRVRLEDDGWQVVGVQVWPETDPSNVENVKP